MEKKNEKNLRSKLDKKYEWWMKSAEKTKKRGRASGGHLIGIRKNNEWTWNVNEW